MKYKEKFLYIFIARKPGSGSEKRDRFFQTVCQTVTKEFHSNLPRTRFLGIVKTGDKVGAGTDADVNLWITEKAG